MDKQFNNRFNDKGDKPRFIYKHNPLVPRSYQVFEFKWNKKDYVPVGAYTVLDRAEEKDLSEKKMMNLITMLNGKDEMIDLSRQVQGRTLFQVVPRDEMFAPTKVIFREHDGSGISRENAIFEIEGGIFDE